MITALIGTAGLIPGIGTAISITTLVPSILDAYQNGQYNNQVASNIMTSTFADELGLSGATITVNNKTTSVVMPTEKTMNTMQDFNNWRELKGLQPVVYQDVLNDEGTSKEFQDYLNQGGGKS